MESILLETDRLILKPGSLEDYYKVYEYDLLKLRDINGEFEFVKQDPKYIKEHVYPGSDNTIYDWVIYLKENGYPIGNIFAEMHDSDDNSNTIFLRCAINANVYSKPRKKNKSSQRLWCKLSYRYFCTHICNCVCNICNIFNLVCKRKNRYTYIS